MSASSRIASSSNNREQFSGEQGLETLPAGWLDRYSRVNSARVHFRYAPGEGNARGCAATEPHAALEAISWIIQADDASLGSRITAAATTGPNNDPRPASSRPAFVASRICALRVQTGSSIASASSGILACSGATESRRKCVQFIVPCNASRRRLGLDAARPLCCGALCCSSPL